MSKNSIRAQRREARAVRLRRQRILLVAFLILVIAVISVLVFRPSPASEPISTSSGLLIEDLSVGDGPEAAEGDIVSVHYSGFLTDGTMFDSSVENGAPFSFTLGVGQVIKGWDEGVAGMKVGGKRKLTIPPDLGYGPGGFGNVIPPNATLVFDIELLEIK